MAYRTNGTNGMREKWHSEMCRYNCSGLDYE